VPAAAPDEGGGPLCEEVSFDAAQCAKSFLYEALPMYASLLMVLFVECALNRRSIRAALALARNRMLYVTTWEGALPPGAPRAASVTMQVLLYLLPNWCMVCALALWYYDADVRRLIDFWELLAFWMIMLMRHLVVGLKYGYLPAAELAAQYSPQYKGLQLAKGIFLGGWATPRAPGFGIVMEQVDAAMWLCDVDLRRCKLQLKLKDATPGYSTTMTAHELALKIAYVSFGRPLAASAGPAAMLTGCLIPFLPPIGRLSVGLAGFGGGTSWAPKLAMFCLIWGPWSLIWLMCAFHRLSLHSYNRRATAMELIDGLCSLGVPSAELELEGEPEPEPEPKPEPEPGLQSEPADPEITALEPPQPQPAVGEDGVGARAEAAGRFGTHHSGLQRPHHGGVCPPAAALPAALRCPVPREDRRVLARTLRHWEHLRRAPGHFLRLLAKCIRAQGIDGSAAGSAWGVHLRRCRHASDCGRKVQPSRALPQCAATCGACRDWRDV
jgi:hypothetical protein